MSTNSLPQTEKTEPVANTTKFDQFRVTATISVRGLTLFCLDKQTGRWEVGLLKHPEHERVLEVREITEGGESRTLPHGLTMDRDVRIEVINPAPHAMVYEPGKFDRKGDVGNEKDFRWIVDLEGPELHNVRLGRKPSAQQHEMSNPFQRVLINDAMFYANKPKGPFVRVKVAPPPAGASAYLGRVAEVVCGDLVCLDQDGSGVLLMNEGMDESKLWLPQKSGSKYEIVFANTRPMRSSTHNHGSDFLLFYDVLSAPDETMFDMLLAVAKGTTGIRIDDDDRYDRNGPHIICDPVFLGKTSSLSDLLAQ